MDENTDTGFCLEYGIASLNKSGEELCGDCTEHRMSDGCLTLVLADGMGSGVKANILSTLTAKLLCTLVANGTPIEECIETIAGSLPVCKIRKMAYSTFSVLHLDRNGCGFLIEFDNPQAILLRKGRCLDLPRESRTVQEKKIWQTRLRLEPEDAVILMSDGVLHASSTAFLNFGWRRDTIMEYLERHLQPGYSAQAIAWKLIAACSDLYDGRPGDDTSAAVVRFRPRCPAACIIGPPVNKAYDREYAEAFLKEPGLKVICGGTTSRIVADVLGREVRVVTPEAGDEIPPIGSLEGIDLVTEGVVTLQAFVQRARRYYDPSDLTSKHFTGSDGASRLCRLLLEEATDIEFLVGQGVNKAHTGAILDTQMKLKLVETIAGLMQDGGKRVRIRYY